MQFTLKTPELELRLEVEKLSKVRIHEEILPELLEKLEGEIKSDGVVKHPVIVDSNTLVVLDGVHRVVAFEQLGCRYLPACLVDYRSQGVKVGCWYRVILGNMSQDKLRAILESLGLRLVAKSRREAIGALSRREALAAILTGKTCHLVKNTGGDIGEICSWIKRLEGALKGKGVSVSYETEEDAEEKVRSGKASATLMIPRIKKEEVIEAALSGRVLAHKTTRHILAARPMSIDVPLKWLKGEMSLEEVNRMLIEHLSKRKVKRLPRGSMFEGRRYEEELWIFE